MQQVQTQRRVYTPNEVMTIFQITRPTLLDWCRKGLLRKIEIPGQRRVFVSADSVDKLLQV